MRRTLYSMRKTKGKKPPSKNSWWLRISFFVYYPYLLFFLPQNLLLNNHREIHRSTFPKKTLYDLPIPLAAIFKNGDMHEIFKSRIGVWETAISWRGFCEVIFFVELIYKLGNVRKESLNYVYANREWLCVMFGMRCGLCLWWLPIKVPWMRICIQLIGLALPKKEIPCIQGGINGDRTGVCNQS